MSMKSGRGARSEGGGGGQASSYSILHRTWKNSKSLGQLHNVSRLKKYFW